MKNWIGRALRREQSTMAPMIGGCVSNDLSGPAGRTDRDVKPVAATPSATEMVGAVSPQQLPMIGIRRGAGYADQFVAEFVACVRRSFAHPVSWTVDDVLTVSKLQFAVPCGIPVPPDRSILAALKRMPGVAVQQDVRGVRVDGGKTTIYTIRPVEVGTDGAAASVSGAPLLASRLAA